MERTILVNKSKYSNQQYKFISELLWGGSPVDRTWAEGTNLFKAEADKILEKYPSLDKSDFMIKRCKSFVKAIRTIDNKIVMYVNYTTKKLIKYENDKGEIKKGTVRINEHLINPDDLSFNNLPHDLKIYYQWDNGYFYNPFDIPDGAILYSYRGEPLRHNKDGKPTPVTDVNGEKTMRNPFNGNICGKFLFENGKAIKRWIVNENNEWEEADLEQD